MTCQSETGHVGQRINTFNLGQQCANIIGLTHHRGRNARMFWAELALLSRRRMNANTQRLGQNELVSNLPAIIALESFTQNRSSHRQPKNRFRAIDTVPAGQRKTQPLANVSAAFYYLTSCLGAQFGDGPSENSHRYQW